MDNKIEEYQANNGTINTPVLKNGQITPAQNVISNYQQAINLYTQMSDDHAERVRAFNAINGLKAGASPIPKDKVREKGLSYLSNTNWRGYKKAAKNVCQNYFQVLKGRFLVDIKYQAGDATTNAILSQKLSRIYTDVLRDWDTWKFQMSRNITKFVDFGFNFLFFGNVLTDEFQSIDAYSILFPKDCQVMPDKIPYFAVVHSYTPEELWKFYSSKVSSSWNKEHLGQLLMLSMHGIENDAQGTAEKFKEASQRILNKEASCQEYFKGNIKVVSLFVKESDNKISRFIFSESNQVLGFLYSKNRAFESFYEIGLTFLLELGVETFGEIKGFGHDTYNTFDIENKLNNGLVSALTLQQSTFFQNKGGGETVKSLKIVPQGINLLPNGLEVAQMSNMPRLDYTIPSLAFLRQSATTSNTYLQATETPHTEQRNGPTNIMGDLTAPVKALKQDIEYFLEQLDIFHKILFGKMFKVKDQGYLYNAFNNALKKEGLSLEMILPQEVLRDKDKYGIPKVLSIKASRIVAQGNVLLDQVVVDRLLEMQSVLPKKSVQRLLKLRVDALTDPNFSDYILPVEEFEEAPEQSHFAASMAANQLEEGKEVVWSPDLDHIVFIQIILDRAESWISRYNEAPDQMGILLDTANALANLITFIAPSVEYLKRDPSKRQFNEYINQRFYQIVGIANGIYANAQKHQEAIVRKQVELENAENQNPQDPRVLDILVKQRLKEMQMQQDYKLKELEIPLKYSLQNAEIQYQATLNERKATVDMDIKLKKANNENIVNLIKASKEPNRGE